MKYKFIVEVEEDNEDIAYQWLDCSIMKKYRDKIKILGWDTTPKRTLQIGRNALMHIYNNNDYLEVDLDKATYEGKDKE